MQEYSTRQLSEDLERALSPADFDRAEQASLAMFDAFNSTLIAIEEISLDCREGCSICCSLRVDTFAHEIFLIARHLQQHWPEAERAALIARLDTHRATVVAMTPFDHVTRNLRCPMLVEGRCSIYDQRPQACRRHHSQDVAACQYTFDHPEDLDTPAAHNALLFHTLTHAMGLNQQAFAEFGFDTTIYELGSALHEALTDPDCWPRWHELQPAFLRSSITPSE